MKRYIKNSLLLIFIFVFISIINYKNTYTVETNLDNKKDWGFYNNGGFSEPNPEQFEMVCGDSKIYVAITNKKNDNTNETGGKINNTSSSVNQDNTVVLNYKLQAGTSTTIESIDIKIDDKTLGKTCFGSIGTPEVSQSNSRVDMDLSIPNYYVKHSGNVFISIKLANTKLLFTSDANSGAEKTTSFTLESLQEVQDGSISTPATTSSLSTTSTTNKKTVNLDDKDTPLGALTDKEGNIITDEDGNTVHYTMNPSSEFECSDGILELINDFWSYVLIIGPIAMIVMGTISFVNALINSNADDGLKKASSDLVKRTIALFILMALKVILRTIFSIFGIEICM